MSTEERVTSDSGGEKGRKMAEVGAIDAVARRSTKRSNLSCSAFLSWQCLLSGDITTLYREG